MGRDQRDEPGSAYTQTYSTGDKTIAAPTATAIDSSAMDDGSGDNVLDVVGDTSGSNQSGPIELNFDKISDEINALIADNLDLRKAVTSLIDDLQAQGIVL